MNPSLAKALLALIPVSVLFAWSVGVLLQERNCGALFQLLGTVCFLVVVLTHVFEALHLFPLMRWGRPDSIGHYLDLTTALLAIILLPLSYFVRRRSRQSSRSL